MWCRNGAALYVVATADQAPRRTRSSDRAERLRAHIVESDRINLDVDAAIRRIVRCEPEGEGRIARTPPIGGADWALERECYEISGLHCIGKPDLIGRYILLDLINIAQRVRGKRQLLDRSEFDRQIDYARAVDEGGRVAQVHAIFIREPAFGAAAGGGPDHARMQDRVAVDSRQRNGGRFSRH